MSWAGQSLQPTAECRAAQPGAGVGSLYTCVNALLCVCICVLAGRESGREGQREGECVFWVRNGLYPESWLF